MVRWFQSLAGKLLFFWLLTIVASLGVVAMLAVYQISRLDQNTALDSIGQSLDRLDGEVSRQAAAIQDVGAGLVQRNDFVAALFMLETYQDVVDYQALIFDIEKQALAGTLHSVLQTSETEIVRVYTDKGDLVGFFLNDVPVPDSSPGDMGETANAVGYMTYVDGAAVPMARWQGERSFTRRMELLSILGKARVNGFQESPTRYKLLNDVITMEVTVPVQRSWPDGRQQNVGWVVINHLLEPSVVMAEAQRRGLQTAVFIGARTGVHQVAGDPLSVMGVDEGHTVARERDTLKTNDHYYFGTYSLPLHDGGKGVFVVAKDKGHLGERIQAFRDITLVGMAVSGVTVLVLGALLLHRMVSRPIGRLMTGVHNLTGGQYVKIDKVDSRDELGDLARSFNQMIDVIERRNADLQHSVDELSRSNTELQRFTYVAAHDLKEPLRSIVSYAQLLDRRYGDKFDGEAKEFLTFLVDGGSRMNDLVRDLLTFTRIDTKPAPFEVVALDTAVDLAQQNLRAAVDECRAEIAVSDLPLVSGDPVQLMELFQNLLGNAVKFRRAGTPCKIEISAGRDGEKWVVSVADNGIGIEPKMSKAIFEVFRRAASSQDYPGTGIGLAICQHIVRRHGGDIWVESEAGKGSTFKFTLPVLATERAMDEVVSPSN